MKNNTLNENYDRQYVAMQLADLLNQIIEQKENEETNERKVA